MIVDGAVVMVENIVRNPRPSPRGRDTTAAHGVDPRGQREQTALGPVFYAIGIIITAYMPIFTLQRVEGPAVSSRWPGR